MKERFDENKCLAILQARVSSTRLPGKVLMPVVGEPMLYRQIERLRRCRGFDRLVVATSTDASDDSLASACRTWGVDCHRGSLGDVLDRFVDAARPYRPDSVVRLTGDCPLADPEVIDSVIRYFSEGGYDYASNIDPPTFPDGLDVEVMRFSCLEQAHSEAELPSEREHVTPFVRTNEGRFRIGRYVGGVDLSHLRWTVDEPQDLAFVRAVYERLFPTRPDFTTADVLALLASESGLASMNSSIDRNQGLKKSLSHDAEYLKGKR